MSYIQFASRAISKPIWRVLDFDTAVQKEIRKGWGEVWIKDITFFVKKQCFKKD